MTIDEIAVNDYVTFIGGQRSHRVTFVGPRYFHIETERGVSGPYSADLVARVER